MTFEPQAERFGGKEIEMITDTHENLLRKALLATNEHEASATFAAFGRKLKSTKVDPHNLRLLDSGEDKPVAYHLKRELHLSEVEAERNALKDQVKRLTSELSAARTKQARNRPPASIRTITKNVRQRFYTTAEAQAEKARIDQLSDAGEIGSESAAKMKGHVSRRTEGYKRRRQ